MNQNLVSFNFTSEQLAAMDAALTALEGAFAALIGLTPDQRKSLIKMGDKSEAFCRQTINVIQQNPDIVPPSYELAEVRSDLSSLDALRPRFARLQQLVERANDTEMALGSDLMVAALTGYALLKVSGRGQGLDGLRQAVSARFARSPKAANDAAAPASAGVSTQ